jgi:tetratricopeptide (TPR) repeat protein
LALWRELGDRGRIARALNTLGDVARCQGDDSLAMVRYDESLRMFEELRDTAGVGSVVHNLAYMALRQGDAPQAATRFAESLRLFQELGNRWSIADCLVGLAGASIGPVDQGGEGAARWTRAARLLGAAEALHGAGTRRNFVGEPANWLEWDRIVAAVQTQLDASTFEAAWAEGQAMPLEQAIAYALGRCS